MKKSLSIYQLIAQISAFLAVPYLFYQAWNPALYPESVTFSLGLSCLPRWVSVGLSKLSVATGNEYLFLMGVLLYIALIGFAVHFLSVCKGNPKILCTAVLGATVLGDVISRLFPSLYLNQIMPPIYQWIAFAVRIAALVMLLFSLRYTIRHMKEA